MKEEYWISKIGILFCAFLSVGSLFQFGVLILLFLENKLDLVPLGITIFLITLGLYILLASFVLLRYPNYKLEGNKLFVRLITGKEISIIPDNTWEIKKFNCELALALTKNKKSVVITNRRIGAKQFKDLCEKLDKMIESNSNKKLQPTAKSGG